MIALLVALAVVFAVALAQGQQPRIPESFTASSDFRVNFTLNGQSIQLQGRGEWAVNQAGKSFISDDRVFSSEHQQWTVYRLERFDLEKRFEIIDQNRTGCNITTLTGNVPLPWAWVEQTRFLQARLVRGAIIDIWGIIDANVHHEIGVNAFAPNRPIFVAFHNMTSNSRREYFFETFIPFPPPARIFDVPRQCGAL